MGLVNLSETAVRVIHPPKKNRFFWLTSQIVPTHVLNHQKKNLEKKRMFNRCTLHLSLVTKCGYRKKSFMCVSQLLNTLESLFIAQKMRSLI